ncbi:MAG: hypothetical protein KBC00_03650 [Candidatus Levybacteria bacterium]|nr:hypothetical protein [Candidatus Levybacteria bacterium]MBP9815447.1 hypothetical protein [Candidatus Levybacteria bacterium]
MIKPILFFSILASFIIIFHNQPLRFFSTPSTHIKSRPTQKVYTTPIQKMQITHQKKILKDVGEAYMENFGITDNDFSILKNAKVDIIEGNFDICEEEKDVLYFLDRAHQYNLKVILPAGAGEAEWGYECDLENYPEDQKPQWQSEKVTSFINKFKNHPALYAWDTSNEAGSVLPNADGKHYLTLLQLQDSYKDVKNTDPNHPVLIRMNGWFFYDYTNNFFRQGNPFGKNVADIVMINAYSNVDDYYPDFVTTVAQRSISEIEKIDKNIQFIIALGAWSEPPLWTFPSMENFDKDISQVKKLGTKIDIAFFKYGANNSGWYLPQNAPFLWKKIKDL